MKLQPPTNCPSCDSILEWKNNLLYCVNTACPGKTEKQVEHFCKTIKIKGLGSSTLKEACINSIYDIYTVNLFDVLKSEKVAAKVTEEISLSGKKSLNEVLPALGIPLIGKSVAGKLSNVCLSIFDINEETCKKAGLGEKTTNNLLNWLSVNLDDLVTKLPFDFLFKKEQGKKICLTGRLKSFKTKSEAEKELVSLGFLVVPRITADVQFAVNETGASTEKTKQAEKLGITVIEDLLQFIGEYK